MSNKIITTAFINEIEAESKSTKKCIERMTPELFGYKPHPKSMEMGYLALLVAEIPLWVKYMVEVGEIDLATFPHLQTRTTEALVKYLDENIAGAKKPWNDEELAAATFTLKSKGEVMYTAPKIQDIGTTINHWVHHRGQLTVYMRMNDIAVPSIYGPSADEKTFG